MNPFEDSFASKELLPQQQPRSLGFPESPSASGTSAGSHQSHNDILSTSTVDKSGTTVSSSSLKNASASSQIAQNVSGSSSGLLVPPAPVTENPPINNSNKHNLRILNFQSLDSERLRGLTPPLFTPGGRRLPPIHFSPSGALGSPGTPGHMWNALINPASGQSQDMLQYANLMRKLGLTPNESNLRVGLTPSIMAQQGFNFNINTPGGFLNGQMTPGLLHLFAFANGVAVPPDNAVPAEAQPFQVPQAHPVAPAPAKVVEEKPETAEEDEHTSDEESEVKQEKEETVKRTASDDGPATKKAKTKGRGKQKEEKKSTRAQSEEEKRKQFLERNRVAASKCRERKKQLFSKMKSELDFYSSGYREMSAQVTQLRNQLMQLRGLLLGHRDCPALVNSVGGYQQMQNIISQTDYVALAAANAQPNYTAIPSNIPTTLNTVSVKIESPSDRESQMATVGQVPVPVPVNGPGVGQVNGVRVDGGGVGVGGVGHVGDVGHIHPVGQVGSLGSASEPPQVGAGDLNMRMPYHGDVESGFQADLTTGMADASIRPINSTSDMPNVKMVNDAYGLRPLASMADLQNGPHPAVVKQYDV